MFTGFWFLAADLYAWWEMSAWPGVILDGTSYFRCMPTSVFFAGGSALTI